VSRTAWRPGDDPGRRSFATLFDEQPLALELGDTIGPVTAAYETWGTLSPAMDNAVLVLHALSGDSHAVGPAGLGHPTAGWWDGLIGPGAPVDTRRWFAVCPNVFGGCQGTTGPSSIAPLGRPFGSRFPELTVRDQVVVEAALADHLGIDRWAAVIGGSMGGMRALEWAVGYTHRVKRLVAIACGASSSAEQIALCATQALAIRSDSAFNGGDYYHGPGPVAGLGLARRIGHISYRCESELAARFGRHAQAGEDPLTRRAGRYSVEGYLDHHADKLAGRFDANSYLVLSRAMDHHDVGRGRGGVEAALAAVTATSTIVSIDSDRLYPPYQQMQLARYLPGEPDLHVVNSPCGHDGFLIEINQVGKVIADALSR
jgi:homoserine O-acetyltransferase/O-succinyltransferase